MSQRYVKLDQTLTSLELPALPLARVTLEPRVWLAGRCFAKSTPYGRLPERFVILRGVYPERLQILRSAQNGNRRQQGPAAA